MSEEKRDVAKRLTQAFDALPENKKEYLLGFADGVVARKGEPAGDDGKEAERK